MNALINTSIVPNPFAPARGDVYEYSDGVITKRVVVSRVIGRYGMTVESWDHTTKALISVEVVEVGEIRLHDFPAWLATLPNLREVGRVRPWP